MTPEMLSSEQLEFSCGLQGSKEEGDTIAQSDAKARTLFRSSKITFD